MRWLWPLFATACGRIAFDPLGDGGDAGDEIVPRDQIVVHLLDPTGAAIADADVVVSPQGTRLRTDTTGTAHVTATSMQRLDVVFPVGAGWRVYSAIDVPPGTAVHLGGYEDTPSLNNMMMTLPARPGIGDYDVRFHDRCNSPVFYGGNNVTIGYAKRCEGERVRAEVLRRETPSTYWLDGGTVTLASGTSVTLTGTYTLAPSFTVRIDNVPNTLFGVAASLFRTDGTPALADVSDPATMTFPVLSPAMLTVAAGPAPNVVRVRLLSSKGRSEQYMAIDPSVSPIVIDALAMLPLYTSLTPAPDGLSAQWAPVSVEDSASAVMYEQAQSIPPLEWTAIVPRNTGSVTFPSLPADLAAATPTKTPDRVVVTTYVVPGLANPFALHREIAAGLSRTLPSFSTLLGP